ncbi:MAG: transcription elongation factor GreA [Holosporales bacterium]|jgi:transcription elongation factor GreA|nr:transcription elongation factor GreA [Holosporales bacterium]
MTLKGYSKLQEELRHLKNVERQQIVDAIAAARELGDLSENAEYHSAKERQGIIEAKILDLTEKLNKAKIINVHEIISDTVKFGATVELMCDDVSPILKFQIVGSDEADIKSGLLPITSPIAKILIGKKKDDLVEVTTPGGAKSYTIVGVKYI